MKMTENVRKTNKKFLILVSSLIIVGLAYGIMKYQHAKHHEDTDDAQLKCDVTAIIPRVPGFIQEVRITDNQQVHKGDTLLILDNRDYKVYLAEAEAGVKIAESNVALAQAGGMTAQSSVSVSKDREQSAGASIDAAKVNLWRATNDFQRYSDLYNNRTITKQQYEQALAAKQSAEAQLKAVESQQNAAQHQSKVAQDQTTATDKQVDVAKANLVKAQASLESAKLNLSYTTILAPVDGTISRVNLQAGQFVQPGMSLFNLVGKKIWAVGNFKETQLTRLQVGQKATVSVDAFPDLEFEGIVSSVSPGTGSEFALLPPDNASGNFVKVVQRIPVKIEFSNPSDPNLSKLHAGLNAEIDIHIENN